MSVKIKMVFGFIVILVLVVVQSWLIIAMNSRRDEMSQMVLALSQSNVVIKDRIIDAKTLEIDLYNAIETRSPIETHARDRKHCYGLSIMLLEWYDVFLTRQEYDILNDALKQKILDMRGPLVDLRTAMESVKDIPPADSAARMKLYLNEVRPAVARFRELGDDFVGQNSQYYSVTSRSLLAYSREMEKRQLYVVGAALLFILFVVGYSNRILQPLNWLMQGVGSIMSGNLNYRVRKRSDDELGRLAELFNSMTGEIRTHRENLEDLVARRTEQYLAAKEETEQVNDDLRRINTYLEEANRIKNLDMRMAVHVQSSFLTKQPPASDEWRVAFTFLPMAGVSGDFYDFYTDAAGRLAGVTLMDVSGHGIASGLITMMAKATAFRVFNTNPDLRLSRIMELVNDDLIGELENVDNYLTGIMLRFSDAQVEYVSAGHVDMLLRRAATGRVERVMPADGSRHKGYFLGIESMREPFPQMDFRVAKGDLLLLYSDCLPECISPEGEEFGQERIMRVLAENPHAAPEDLMNLLVDRMYEFTQSHALADDLTIIALERRV